MDESRRSRESVKCDIQMSSLWLGLRAGGWRQSFPSQKIGKPNRVFNSPSSWLILSSQTVLLHLPYFLSSLEIPEQEIMAPCPSLTRCPCTHALRCCLGGLEERARRGWCDGLWSRVKPTTSAPAPQSSLSFQICAMGKLHYLHLPQNGFTS